MHAALFTFYFSMNMDQPLKFDGESSLIILLSVINSSR